MADVDLLPDETPEQWEIHLHNETKAGAISDHIDEQISGEKEEIARHKKAGDIKVLILLSEPHFFVIFTS